MISGRTTICLSLLHILIQRAIGLPNCSSLTYVDKPYEQLAAMDESVEAMCGTYRPVDCEHDEKIAILIPYSLWCYDYGFMSRNVSINIIPSSSTHYMVSTSISFTNIYRICVCVTTSLSNRNREIQLRILTNYLIQFLVNYRKYFGIFVIEPIGDQIFNRGKLFNAGFAVARSVDSWDCVFFHDVDLLPTNRSLPYKCPRKGRAQHWSSAVDKFGFKLPYEGYVGGVTAMNSDEFIAINGYPNEFWGWGGEDDCFGRRIRNSNIQVERAPNGATTYTMLRHGQNEKGNEINPCRIKILDKWRDLWHFDGLNSLSYNIVSFDVYNSYHHLFVDLDPPKNTCEIVSRDINNDTNIEELFGKPPPTPPFIRADHCALVGPVMTLQTTNVSSRALAVIVLTLSVNSLIVLFIFCRGFRRHHILSLFRRRETDNTKIPLV